MAASNKAFLTCSPTDCAMLDRLISLTKGVGTGGDGGDVSPPMLETGAFVPPKNYTAKYLILIFFFNDTATTEIYTLSLHDALPI